MDKALKSLWRHGQADSAPGDAALNALFAGSDQAAEAALDQIAESPRAASMVRVAAGLRGDAEELSREVKQLRQPRALRQVTVAQRWPWAVAASVALMAWWAMPPGHQVAPTSLTAGQGADVPRSPASNAMEVDAGAGRILAASFEGRVAEAEPKLFSASFDS